MSYLSRSFLQVYRQKAPEMENLHCILHLKFFSPEESLEVSAIIWGVKGPGECTALDILNLHPGGTVLQRKDDIRGNRSLR